jgi:hypothetical protein
MALPKISYEGKGPALGELLYGPEEIELPIPEKVVSLDPALAAPIVEEKIVPLWPINRRPMLPSRIAIIGN